MAVSNLPIPMEAFKGRPLLPMSAEPPRAVYLYENKQRTEKARLSEVTGRPLFRFDAQLQISDTVIVPVTLLLDSDAPLPLMQAIPLDYARSVLAVRPEDQYSLALSVTGTLRTDKGGA